MSELALAQTPDILIETALSGLSPQTRRVYAPRLRAYLLWQRDLMLCRESVQLYLKHLDELGSTTTAINQTLSAVKTFVKEAAANGWVTSDTSERICSLTARPKRGKRYGKWLDLDQAKALINAPDPQTVVGKRDRAVLALLIGCGLRRDELAQLEWHNFTGDKISNIKGKGNRTRTISYPRWVANIVLEWCKVSAPHIEDTYALRSFNQNGTINGSISTSAIWKIVRHYSALIGIQVAPHDLRRTFAHLSRLGGAPLESIQLSLGHSSLTTTQIYLKSSESGDAGDYIKL